MQVVDAIPASMRPLCVKLLLLTELTLGVRSRYDRKVLAC